MHHLGVDKVQTSCMFYIFSIFSAEHGSFVRLIFKSYQSCSPVCVIDLCFEIVGTHSWPWVVNIRYRLCLERNEQT